MNDHSTAKDVVSLLAVLTHLNPLSKGLPKYLINNTYPIKLNKSKHLVKAGDISTHIWFVKKGILRGYIKDGNKEITTWITAEDDLVAGINSFFSQAVADEYIQAVEHCELIGLSFEDLERAYKLFPSFNIIARKLYQKNYINAENRAIVARLVSAEKKYQYFLNTQSHLVNRVPVKLIASFLGIAKETLSRIRKKHTTTIQYVD